MKYLISCFKGSFNGNNFCGYHHLRLWSILDSLIARDSLHSRSHDQIGFDLLLLHHHLRRFRDRDSDCS